MTPESHVGTQFGGYRIEAVVGRGGMGVVYRAEQLTLKRTVALKVIAPELAEDPGFRARFEREAQLAAALDHPNVLPVHETGEHEGMLYLVLRYVEGTDLAQAIADGGPLEPGRAARIVAQVGEALDAAHEGGLVHRDVKPANILLAGAGEHAYLSDFGLTKRTTSAAGLTRTGEALGSVDYMAPEQIRGEPVDGRVDVYALGAVLYRALTGARPYERDSDAATMWAHVNDPPPLPSEAVPTLPPVFDEIVARAMAKDREERYPSAGDLGRAAIAAAEGRPVSTPEQEIAATVAVPTMAAGRSSTPTAQTVPAGTEALPRASASAESPWWRRSFAVPIILLVLVGAVGGALAAAGVFGGGGGDTAAEPSSGAAAANGGGAAASNGGGAAASNGGGAAAAAAACDLAGQDLRGCDFRGEDLAGDQLAGADLTNANLEGANLRGTILRDASLQKANLEGADLTGANLANADLYQSVLKDADLSRTNLRLAKFEEATVFSIGSLDGAETDEGTCWPARAGAGGEPGANVDLDPSLRPALVESGDGTPRSCEPGEHEQAGPGRP